MPDPTALKPPYVSPTSFKNFLETLPGGVIPSRIDKSIMGKMSGGGQTSILAALKFFEMIDELGNPTDNFKSVVEGSKESKQAAWKRIVEKSYGFLFTDDLDLERATEGQLADKFRAHDLNGDTLRKCQVFFVSVCESAGIPLGPLLKPKSTKGGGVRVGVRRKPRKQNSAAENPPAANDFDDASGTSKTHVLHLNTDGTRLVKINAPLDMSTKEVNRIKKWLEVTFFIEWEEEEPTK